MRFGRRLPLPSTADIKHELRLMASGDALREAAAAQVEDNTLTPSQTNVLVGDLATKHGLSVERAGMLVEKFGMGANRLGSAAAELSVWKT